MDTNIRARTGKFCQSIATGHGRVTTYWGTRGSRDRFCLAVAATEGDRGRHVTSRPRHWS